MKSISLSSWVRDFNARELRTKNHEMLHKNLKRNVKGQSAKLRQCYVYELRVDGVVRYIGKGFTINSANMSCPERAISFGM
jgi:hypothetical protein